MSKKLINLNPQIMKTALLLIIVFITFILLVSILSCKKDDTTINSYSCQSCITRGGTTCGPFRTYKFTKTNMDSQMNHYNKTYVDKTDGSKTIYKMTCAQIY